MGVTITSIMPGGPILKKPFILMLVVQKLRKLLILEEMLFTQKA